MGKRNISPSTLADDIGMSRANMSHWLNGRAGRQAKPSLDLARAAAKRLRVRVQWLLDGIGLDENNDRRSTQQARAYASVAKAFATNGGHSELALRRLVRVLTLWTQLSPSDKTHFLAEMKAAAKAHKAATKRRRTPRKGKGKP